MSAKKSAVTKAIESIQNEAAALDARRQLQIRNQIETINRLIDDPSTSKEIETLNAALADAQTKAIDALLEAKRLRDLYEPDNQEAKTA